MFEITADDISLLNDEDLRTLVGLLFRFSEEKNKPTRAEGKNNEIRRSQPTH
jgi:hypothetical protein